MDQMRRLISASSVEKKIVSNWPLPKGQPSQTVRVPQDILGDEMAKTL